MVAQSDCKLAVILLPLRLCLQVHATMPESQEVHATGSHVKVRGQGHGVGPLFAHLPKFCISNTGFQICWAGSFSCRTILGCLLWQLLQKAVVSVASFLDSTPLPLIYTILLQVYQPVVSTALLPDHSQPKLPSQQ